MDSDRWREVRAAFDQLIELDPAAQEERLAALERSDPELRHLVEALLRADADADAQLAHVTRALSPQSAGLSDNQAPDALGLRGQTVAHFRILEPLGAGGMGAVYSAEDLGLGRTIALKLPLPAHRLDSSVKARFLQEARTVGALDHPNVCSVYEAGETDDGQLYLAMAFYRGETLKVRLAREGSLPVAEAVAIGRQMVQGLAAAHDAGVVHRDLKPGNVMLLPGGGVKILDFGLAKVRDLSITGSGVLLGTAAYMSPEQIRGEPVDGRTDLWAFGVVLYEMLAGRQPFQGENEVSVAHAIIHEEPARPSEYRKGIPPALEDLILSLLEKAAAQRPATAQVVDAELAALERGRRQRPLAAMRRWLRLSPPARRSFRRWSLPAAALAVAAAFAGYTAFRGAESPAEPSLVGAGLLAPRDRVLLADFEDLAGDPLLAAAVTEAFRVDLAESPLVRVLSPRQVRAALSRMERAPDVTLDDSLAHELAIREGVKALVTGSVARVPGSYTISLQLLGATNGDLLVGLREAAADSNDVVGAVDRLSERLRAKIGESMRELRAEPPLAQVTTASLPALRLYSEGTRLINSGDRTGGIERLERAVVLDTGFASAWRLLGVTYGDVAEPGRMVQGVERALANQSRLPFYERYHTLASYAMNVQGDPDAAIEAYRRVLQRHPDDVRALNNQAVVLKFHRRFAEAETLFARAISVDSSIASIHIGLSGSLLLQGDFGQARGRLDTAARLFPHHFNVRLAEIYLAAAQQDWALAERHARARLAADPADTLDALDGLETLAGLAMTQGRLAEAERHSNRVLRLSRLVGSPARHLSSAIRLGYVELRYRNARERALAVVEKGLAAFPLDSMPEGDRPYLELSRFFAAAGQPDRAREQLDQESRTELGRRRVRAPLAVADRLWARGRVTLVEGRYQNAAADLRRAADIHFCTICALPDLGRAYEASGDIDWATATYQRYLTTPWEHRFEPDAIELGFTLRRLAALYQLQGDPGKARDAYTRLAELWRRADPELQPHVAEARAALERLGS
jgi:eukaryotic-like serine/threonine-protein kinase